MCNRYRVTVARAEAAARFGVTLIPDADTLPPPELFPKRPAWVVRRVGDQRQLELELPVYDALYAWAQQQVTGSHEP